MSLQLRRKVHESVVYIDRDSAPRIVASGMDFLLEDLPIGTRVIYPNQPLKGLVNREAAIRYALCYALDENINSYCRFLVNRRDFSVSCRRSRGVG